MREEWLSIADNYPEPGKRPLSSTCASIIENSDGSFYAAMGGAGGSRIFPSVVQTLLYLDWGMDIQEAVEHGRLHDQLYPLEVDVDSTFPDTLVSALVDRGHAVSGELLRDRLVWHKDQIAVQSKTSIA